MIFDTKEDLKWLTDAMSRELRAAVLKHAGEGAWMLDATQMLEGTWQAIMADAARPLLASIAYRLGERTKSLVDVAISEVDQRIGGDPIIAGLAALDEPGDPALPLAQLIRAARQRLAAKPAGEPAN
jgi:hypothetical protein